MRKIHLLTLALFAVFALGALTATAAFAVPEWLWNGNPLVAGEELLVEVTGEVETITLAHGISPEIDILCSGAFAGVLLAEGLGLVTELLNLSGEKIALGLRELACTPVKGCESATPEDTFVTAENLPWESLLTLDSPKPGENLYLVLISEDLEPGGGSKGSPAYELRCLIGGVEAETLCEGHVSVNITLGGNELLGFYSPEELELENLEGLCEILLPVAEHVESVAVASGEGPIRHAGGGELDVSG